MEVCKICVNGGLHWDGPSSKFTELEESANGGCHMCSIIIEGHKYFAGSKAEGQCSMLTDNSRGGLLSKLGGKFMQYFTWKGAYSPWHILKYRQMLKRDSTFEGCMNLIRSHVSRCESQHQKCRSYAAEIEGPNSAFMPTRLIYVASQAPHDLPRLIKSFETQRYCALSHCWGTSQMMTTTQSTIKGHENGMAWNSLPKTFQDAISVTRALGIDYLWIDSLCIIQEDVEDVEDWARECSRMQHVHANAYVTIGATGAKNSSEGLFFERPGLRKISGVFEQRPYDVNIQTMHDSDIFTTTSPRSFGVSSLYPLLDRAWTFQEQWHSNRFVHFTRNEIAWVCQEEHMCECTGEAIRDSSGLSRLHRDNWYHIIETYTRKKITYDQDRLPAISSLGTCFQEGSGSYLSGIWQHDLPRRLFWRAEGARRAATRIDPPSSPPSWSWASVEGHDIRWLEDIEEPGRNSIVSQVLEASVDSSTSDPRGLVSGGHVTLRGRLFELDPTSDFLGIGIKNELGNGNNVCSNRIYYSPDIADRSELTAYSDPPTGQIFFLVVCSDGEYPRHGGPSSFYSSGLLLGTVLEPLSFVQASLKARTNSDILCQKLGVAWSFRFLEAVSTYSSIQTVTII